MIILSVVYNKEDLEYLVVNTYDGVVVGKFYTRADAEDFAWSEEANEQHRIYKEYG